MNDMDMNTPGMSELLYVALCLKVGFPTQVRIRREVLDLQETIETLISMKQKQMQLSSGSFREGFRFHDSDMDFMEWRTDHKVIWDYNQSDFYRSSDTTLIMMECCDTRPGFALLQLLTPSRNRQVRSSCTTMNDGLYISSSLYREKTLALSGLKTTTHGPCTSGFLGGVLEYDNAYCFSCDLWPPLASSFIERSQIKGWPPTRVLRDIVDTGCHFVPIGRRNSPQEHNEWRISFSVAEQKLVYAMNHSQFLCYGMLKIFLKEVLNSYSAEHLLCSYFLKTVVFWEIQGLEIHTWTPQNILMCIWQCVKHLIKLVYKAECPNFFIPSNNMFYGKIVGAARMRLLSQLEAVYSMGISHLLHCTSIMRIMQMLLWSCSTQRIDINDNFWLSTADYDMHAFHEISISRVLYEDTLMGCYNTLSILKTIEQTPLSEYQSVALQFNISCALVYTAFHLHVVYNSACYTNRVQYYVDRQLRHMLYSAAKCGDISNLLYIAMYYYMTCRYKQALSYVEITKSKLSKPYVIYIHKVDKRRYNEAVQGMRKSLRMREAYISNINLHSKFVFIPELTLEIKSAERKTGEKLLTIPIHVMVSMLSVLCHRDNPRKQEEAIYDLQTLLPYHHRAYICPHGAYVCPHRAYICPCRIHLCNNYMKNILWEILGLCQQIYGDLRAALVSYQEALKYTKNQINVIEEATKARIQHVQCAIENNSLDQ